MKSVGGTVENPSRSERRRRPEGRRQGRYDYTRYMQDKLGFVYSHNNFTDFAPVNEYWRTDIVSKNRKAISCAWARCYAPKPSTQSNTARNYANHPEKFNFGTACRVHTSVTPGPNRLGAESQARAPLHVHAFGEIILHQKNAWKGRVLEGQHHCYYSYHGRKHAQDRSYYLPTDLLVDFDRGKFIRSNAISNG